MNLNNLEQSVKTKAAQSGRSTRSIFYLIWDFLGSLIWIAAIIAVVAFVIMGMVAQGVVEHPLLLMTAERTEGFLNFLLKVFSK